MNGEYNYLWTLGYPQLNERKLIWIWWDRHGRPAGAQPATYLGAHYRLDDGELIGAFLVYQYREITS